MACEVKRHWLYLSRTGATAFELTCSAASSFSEGFASVLVKGSIGYIDTTGAMVIRPQFEQGRDFKEGLAAVEVIDCPPAKRDWSKPQRFGFVDRTGSLAIPADFHLADSFSDGLAAVLVSGGRGYIDKSGKMVIPPIQCSLALPFAGDLAAIQDSCGGVGYIDRQGEFVWPIQR
jgi:hypothetical protein